MKKVILFIASVLSIMGANAQDNSIEDYYKKGKVHWGITTGPGVSTISTKDEGITTPKLSIQLGVTSDIHLTDNAYLETGLLLQAKSYNFNRRISQTESKHAELSTMYLTMPVTYNYKIKVGKISFDPQVGGYFAFSLSDSGSKGVYQDGFYQRQAKITDAADRIDFGLRYGLGIQFNERFKLSATYDCGLLTQNWSVGTNQNISGTFTFFFK